MKLCMLFNLHKLCTEHTKRIYGWHKREGRVIWNSLLHNFILSFIFKHIHKLLPDNKGK